MCNICLKEIEFYEKERDVFLERAKELSGEIDQMAYEIIGLQNQLTENLEHAKRAIDKITDLQEH